MVRVEGWSGDVVVVVGSVVEVVGWVAEVVVVLGREVCYSVSIYQHDWK